MVKKIAILGLKRIGDAIYTLPLIEAVQLKFGCKVDVFTQPHVKDIYTANPYIKNVFSFSKKDFWVGTLQKLKAENYDICIVLHSSFKYALLPFLAKVPVRIGYQKELRSWLLTNSIPLPKLVVHRMVHNANLAKLIDVDSTKIEPHIYFTEDEAKKIPALLTKFSLNPQKYITFIVGSNAVERRWFPENFAKVAETVIKDYGLKVCILGAKEDFEIGVRVLDSFNGDGKCLINLAGKTSLRETMYLFKESNALITNDTGPMHVASTIGIPVITWFGPTIENEVGPPSKNTVVLNSTAEFDKGEKDHSHQRAIESLHNITPDTVLKAFDKLIKSQE